MHGGKFHMVWNAMHLASEEEDPKLSSLALGPSDIQSANGQNQSKQRSLSQ
jgi:hypothetical protein